MKNLSRLQIVGIVLSIFWLFYSFNGEYQRAIDAANSISEFTYKTCVENNATSIDACSQEKINKYELYAKYAWRNASLTAIIPLPFYWLYAVIFITLYRSFKVGLGFVVKTDEMSKAKKYFTYFCYVFSVASVLFLLLVAMNKMVDERVPTYLGFKKSLTQYEGYVNITGTWVNADTLDQKNKIYAPLQTSRIICQRENMQCHESKAVILPSDNTPSLDAELLDYKVRKWTKDTIIYSTQYPCYDAIYTVDLNSQSVGGVEKFAVNVPNEDFCKARKNDREAKWKLENGYTVYSDLRREASPYLLKLVYAFFGN